MHQSDIPQCAIQNRNVYISDLNGTLCDMGHVGALWDLWINFTEINQINKSHNAPIRYPTMHHSEQKYAQFFSVYCGIWDRCIGGFVNLIYCFGHVNMPRKLKQTRTEPMLVLTHKTLYGMLTWGIGPAQLLSYNCVRQRRVASQRH